MARYMTEAGAATLELLLTRPNGMAVNQLAKLRGITNKVARKALARLCEMKLVEVAAAGETGLAKLTLIYRLTRLGNDVAEGVIALDEIEDEDDDRLDVFPRKPWQPIIAEAVRTQPTSVFDLARMLG